MGTTDDELVRIAERRNNLITTGELERLGLCVDTIGRRTSRGSLRRIAPEVHTTSARPDGVPERELALCLAYPSAVLSHASAAAYSGVAACPEGSRRDHRPPRDPTAGGGQ